MKVSEFKCPECGELPDPNLYSYELIEPVTAYRRIYFTTVGDEVTRIETSDTDYEETGKTHMLRHACGEVFDVPAGFFDYTIYE